MQELKILRWCNACYADGEARVEATERYVIVVDTHGGRNGQPRELDFCEPHAKAVRELRELVLKTGAPLPPKGGTTEVKEEKPAYLQPVVATTVEGDKRRACPVCGKSVRLVTLNGHLHAVHGARSVRQPKKCPDCGKSIELSRMMAVHRGQKHGYDYMAELAATVPKRGRRGQPDA